jgi:hypothetical protein
VEGDREKIDGTWEHRCLVSRNSRGICRAGYVVLLTNLKLKYDSRIALRGGILFTHGLTLIV